MLENKLKCPHCKTLHECKGLGRANLEEQEGIPKKEATHVCQKCGQTFTGKEEYIYWRFNKPYYIEGNKPYPMYSNSPE